MTTITKVVGDSILWQCTKKSAAGVAQDLTGWSISSQLRTKAGVPYSLVVVIDPDQVTNPGEFTITGSVPTTTGEYYWNIRYTDPSGFVISTENNLVKAVDGATQ